MIQLRRRTVALAAAAFVAVAGLAALSFVRTLTPAEAGAGFTDTPPWIAAHAAWLQDNGIADGFPDGTFKPDDNISRGQAAYWFGNYNDSIEVVELTNNVPSADDDFSFIAHCPAGKRAIGGGAHLNNNDLDLMMTSSYTADGQSWQVRYETEGDKVVTVPPVNAYALCIPDPIPEP